MNVSPSKKAILLTECELFRFYLLKRYHFPFHSLHYNIQPIFDCIFRVMFPNLLVILYCFPQFYAQPKHLNLTDFTPKI